MTTKKQETYRNTFLKQYTSVILLATSLIFNAATLIILPLHFSVVAIILLLTSFCALFIVNNPTKLRNARNGLMFCFSYSLIYLLIILYWNSAGDSACSEFFGSYRSCLGSAQQAFVEIFAVPVILLTATLPAFKKRV